MVVCDSSDWRDFREFRFCTIHNLKFALEGRCPRVSRGGTSERFKKAKLLRRQGKTLQQIGTELHISHQAVSKLLGSNRKRKTPLRIRLHNEEFSAQVSCDYAEVHGKVINKGRNLEYKRVKSKLHHIKLHRNRTMTVRFKEDIYATTTDEALRQSDLRLVAFISNFWVAGVELPEEMRVINRHYGLLGSEHAKKMLDERHLIIVRDPLDQKVRLRIDQSVPPAEIDAEHPEKGKADTDYWQAFHEDITFNKPLLLSQQQAMLYGIIKTSSEYAENIKRHLEVQTATLKTLKDISRAVKQLPKAGTPRRAKRGADRGENDE